MPGRSGSFRLFRLRGITVFVHWSWFLIAAYEISERSSQYQSRVWNVYEYLALFGIVLLHEFGHALACRSVGGEADQIVLWPLGGVAYVNPPPRPGPTLWSLAAGPLVNVALLPVTGAAYFLAARAGWAQSLPDIHALLRAIAVLNLGLLVFNVLPIYPLDGGQMLRALLWFVIGRAKSLLVTTVIGFVGVAALVVLALGSGSTWLLVLAGFMLLNCWGGLKQARVLIRLARLPRRPEFACPACASSPPLGAHWACGQCRTPFDTFETSSTCPGCGTRFDSTACFDCGGRQPLAAWSRARPQAALPDVHPGGGLAASKP